MPRSEEQTPPWMEFGLSCMRRSPDDAHREPPGPDRNQANDQEDASALWCPPGSVTSRAGVCYNLVEHLFYQVAPVSAQANQAYIHLSVNHPSLDRWHRVLPHPGSRASPTRPPSPRSVRDLTVSRAGAPSLGERRQALRPRSPCLLQPDCHAAHRWSAWTEDTLLAKVAAENQERERRDGIRRHFAVPWWVVAEHVPDYGRYVEGEKARLGESHPLFRTQYALETISGGGRFFSPTQLAQMIGRHARLRRPQSQASGTEVAYVAGVDVAGEDEEAADAALRRLKPRKDSTVVTIARLDYADVAAGIQEPRLEVVEHYWWTGRDHRTQFAALLDLLRDVWRVARVCVDGTGVGAGVASFLQAALGEAVCEVVQFSAARKSELGYGLLAAVSSGRLKVYAEPEQSDEAREWWAEVAACRYEVRANQQIGFFVPETEGHDDFVVSAALCVAAGRGYGVAPAGTEVRAKPAYADERW